MTDISGSPFVSVRSVLQRALAYLSETPKESWCAIVRDAKIALARSPAEDAIESIALVNLRFEANVMRAEASRRQRMIDESLRQIARVVGESAVKATNGDLPKLLTELVDNLIHGLRVPSDPVVCSSKKEAEAVLRARELEIRIEHLKEDRERARRERDEARDALADARARYRRHIGSD